MSRPDAAEEARAVLMDRLERGVCLGCGQVFKIAAHKTDDGVEGPLHPWCHPGITKTDVYRAGLLRGAEIARRHQSGLEYAHSIAEQSVAKNIATAIEAEANKEVPRG